MFVFFRKWFWYVEGFLAVIVSAGLSLMEIWGGSLWIGAFALIIAIWIFIRESKHAAKVEEDINMKKKQQSEKSDDRNLSR
jgi:nucleoside recognition membrane protein YjiH